MKMNFYFTVIARCNVYTNESTTEPNLLNRNEDIELQFGKEEAENFLLRFAPICMKLGEYKVVFRNSSIGTLTSVSLMKDDKIYIVKNLNQVINDVLQGYLEIRTYDKVSSIMNFDFDAAIDILDDPKDEVEVEEENK